MLWNALVHIAYIYIFLIACSIIACVWGFAEVAWDYYEYGERTKRPAEDTRRSRTDRRN